MAPTLQQSSTVAFASLPASLLVSSSINSQHPGAVAAVLDLPCEGIQWICTSRASR